MIKALDSLMLRHDVVSENIANASTQGYRPRKVAFEAALAAASRQGASALEAFRPTITAQIPNALDSGVRIDKELFAASGAAGRYGAIVEIFDRQMQIADLPLQRS